MAQARRFLPLCIAAALASSSRASGVSPVQKVLQLLAELKGKVTTEVAEESQAMEEYMAYCNEGMREKGYAIKTATRQIADLSATIEEEKATIIEADADISRLSGEIAGKEKDLKNETKVRKFAKIDFEFEEKKLLKGIEDAAKAADTIGSGMSLAQTGTGGAQAEGLKETLAAVRATAAIVGGASEQRLRSFLQASTVATVAESDDLSLTNALRQPQAKTSNFESQSGGILEVVEKTKEDVEKELEELRKKEMMDAHEFSLLEAGLQDEIKNLKEKLGAATALKQSSTEGENAAASNLVDTKEGKTNDEEFMKTLKRDCSTKAEEWEERFKSATGELAAIAKASEILETGVTATSFMQVSAVRGDNTRLRVAQVLRTLGRQYHSFALVELSAAAASDPFVKIRGLIQDMIDKLTKEAEEEANQKAFCDEEMSKSKATQSKNQGKADTLKARMDSSAASVAELTQAIKKLETEIADIDKSQQEATKIRTSEKAANTKAATEYRESAAAVDSAMAVLKEYYEGASLLQVRSTTRQGSAGADAGNAIIGVLEAAESDFTQLLSETEADESVAAKAYDDLTQENKVSRAEKAAAAKSKSNQVNSLNVQISRQEEDHASVAAELDAVNAYIEKLKPQCTTQVMSKEDEFAAREAEIEGLKEALAILEGK